MENKVQPFTLSVDNEPDIRFIGFLVGSVTSHSQNKNDRWTELFLYKTHESGRYICYEIGRTKFQGECDRFKASVVNTEKEVRDVFGHGWLAKQLYAECGIEDIIEIK